ncbi:MAG: Crp/Fnr family transcriptional regulator [Armatimonadota bacterium]|nr:Crp/Fnr family transcriptional regulator [Armatimonadota bacterium]MDR7450635.1 Crp/Fnr family transcriptional regulator [Armatimonadota bacterium]MDR7466232.1 Crp/Fnr family transcriptional regulator [Armatimonadota bacterium]MDR7492953.1 Crp/Fnr family transcriptional regulator [Armatimonadota bacterium]MDR7498290.1 Crp/Fnr family transcriptional regulator [Armatimonadota bacterium]
MPEGTDPGAPIVNAAGRLAEVCGHLSVVRRYRAGTLVFQQGELPDQFYQLLSGRVQIFLGHPEGHEHVLAIVEPGGLFGEAACFGGLPYYTSAVTVQPSTIRIYPLVAVLEVMRSKPDLSLEIIRGLARKLHLFAVQLETTSFRKASERLALLLSKLAVYYGIPLPRGKGTRIGVRLSHEGLARMIGATRVTVTREIGALVRDGILAQEKRNLIVLRHERLLRRAGLF